MVVMAIRGVQSALCSWQVLLVCFAGMMAGLTLGLLSLDKCASRAACACLALHLGTHTCRGGRGHTPASLLGAPPASPHLPACGLVVSTILLSCLHVPQPPGEQCVPACRVDLEVIKRSGNEKQRWLVTQVEPVSGYMLTAAHLATMQGRPSHVTA